jgi:hypothetical protein
MRRVIRGKGIKLLDEQVEAAAFRILIGVYQHLVTIQDNDDLDEVLFVFKEYIYREYERLYSFLKALDKHYDACDCMEKRIERFKKSELLIGPSEILGELEQIKKFKRLIQVQEVSVLCCIKLK